MWWFFYVKKRYTVTIIIPSCSVVNGDIAMKKNCYVFLCGASFVIFYVFYSYTTEYIYPLTKCLVDEQEVVLFMHQTTTQETRLWSLNMGTHCYEQLLSSQYNPVGVALLPDGSGFSFLDNGLIKVKKFLKRSPKTIEIYEPLYSINAVQWLDDTTCFFHAKQGNRYGIYQVTLDGQLDVIIQNSSCDYLYPQKVDADLFFVCRDGAGNNYVEKMMYPSFKNRTMSLQEALNYEQDTAVSLQSDLTVVQNFNKETIVTVSMINKREGFLVCASPTVNASESLMAFSFYKLEFLNDIWEKKELFIFHLPTYLFFNKSMMLREVVPAFFPIITVDGIYFTSLQKNESCMSLFHYSEHSGFVVPCKTHTFLPASKDIFTTLSQGNYGHVLIPIVTNNGLLSGYAWEQLTADRHCELAKQSSNLSSDLSVVVLTKTGSLGEGRIK